MSINIDLGCGNAKRDGYIGLDYVAGEQVDHVLDLTADRYPIDDASVDAVFSAHFLEHIDEPNHVFSEIGRVCRDGAKIEFWTPYAFSDEAFLYGHTHFMTEQLWMHFCVSHRDAFAEMLGGRWLLRNIDFVVAPETASELRRHGVSMDFAIKYLKGVVKEFGVDIEFRRDLDAPVSMPARSWSTTRWGDRRPLVADLPGNRDATGFVHRVHHKLRRRFIGSDLGSLFRHVDG
jgi:predicted SAM-dependent methyltransferase